MECIIHLMTNSEWADAYGRPSHSKQNSGASQNGRFFSMTAEQNTGTSAKEQIVLEVQWTCDGNGTMEVWDFIVFVKAFKTTRQTPIEQFFKPKYSNCSFLFSTTNCKHVRHLQVDNRSTEIHHKVQVCIYHGNEGSHVLSVWLGKEGRRPFLLWYSLANIR